jgi:hypothetical protein
MSDNARATCFDEGRFHCKRVAAICVVLLFARPSVPFFRGRPCEAPYVVTRCICRNPLHRDPASHVQLFVSPVATDLDKSNQLDRTPMPAVCNFYTITKQIHVIHNTVYNTRVNQFDCQGPSSLQPVLQSPCRKLINWQPARVYASLL